MSYDIIETFVVSSKRALEPAQLVQLEGDLQFTRFLPLQMPTKVEPYFSDLLRYVEDFEHFAKRIQEDFIRCGYFLNLIKRQGLYRYCIQEGQQGYTDFYCFCSERLGVSRSTAQRLIDINAYFCKNGPEIPVRYENYGASKLAIMSTFKNGLEKKLNPSVTVRQLEKLKKYYSKHGWNVNLNTKWTDDLLQFDEEVRQERLLKSKRLKEVKFVSAKEEAVASFKKVGKPYKAFTKFYDEIFRQADYLYSDDPEILAVFNKTVSALKEHYAELLRLQSGSMLDGL